MSLILDGTNGLSDVDGSAATPAIRGTDANTGMFFPAADTIAFAEGGTEAMRIDSSGNVGIGTSSPTVKLDVLGASGVVSRIKSTGNYTGLAIDSSTTTGGGYLSVLQNGTNCGIFSTSGAILGDTSTDAAVGAETGKAIRLYTNGFTERMRIDSSGNVIVGGTSTPYGLLHVNYGGSNAAYSARNGNTVGTYAVIGDSNTWIGGLNTSSATGTTALLSLDSNQGTRFITNSAERMRIDSSGNLFVGTTSTAPNPGVSLTPAGNITAGNSAGVSGFEFHTFRRSGTQIGSITQSGTTAVAYNTSSDYRLKENIASMTGALATVAQLKPVTYKWKVDGSSGQGFIAHELQAIVPDCVTGQKDGLDAEGNPKYQGVDTSFLVATLTAAIQEQQALITDLTTRLAALEGVK
jgi:hypothetical protein